MIFVTVVDFEDFDVQFFHFELLEAVKFTRGGIKYVV